jgi:hypothetical protein
MTPRPSTDGSNAASRLVRVVAARTAIVFLSGVQVAAEIGGGPAPRSAAARPQVNRHSRRPQAKLAFAATAGESPFAVAREAGGRLLVAVAVLAAGGVAGVRDHAAS